MRCLGRLISGCPLLAVLLAAAPASAIADPVIAAAGDIACDPTNPSFNDGAGTGWACSQAATAALMRDMAPDAVLPLGDSQYECGGYSAFMQSYDRSWGLLKGITRPVVGNHEYITTGGTGCDPTNADAAGHFLYFGAAAGQPGQGWYSYDLGSWHLIALNSSCDRVGGCTASSPQGQWLAQDLASHTNACTLAYWHIPLFSSGGRDEPNSRPLWDVLHAAGVDVVLAGHDHIYERFAPQTPAGELDERTGITQFVVGTGGANHTTLPGLAANSEVREANSYGVLRMALHPKGYEWRFAPVPGAPFRDSGARTCHGAPGDPVPGAPVFQDGFEEQDLTTRWSFVSGLQTQQGEAFSGARAARSTSTSGTAAWAWKQLPAPESRLTTRLRFKVISQGPNVFDLLKLRTATGSALLTVFTASDGRLGYQNNLTGLSRYSTIAASRGNWHSLEVRTVIAGADGRVEILLDGQPITSRTEALGTTPIGRLQIAENITGRTYDVALDDVGAEIPDTVAPTTPGDAWAARATDTSLDLAWTASSDAGGVAGYHVYVDGLRVAGVPDPSHTVLDLACGRAYTVAVEAFDGAGNVSGRSSAVASTASCPPVILFEDGFEAQDLTARWSFVSGLLRQQAEVFSGAWAARATSTSGTAAWAWKQLPAAQSRLTARLRFKVIGQGSNVLDLLKLRTATGSALLTVFIAPDGRLGYQNNLSALSRYSTTTASRGNWHSLEVRTAIAGADGRVEILLDGQPATSQTEPLGTTPIGRLQIGENITGRTYDLAIDDVAADAG